MCKLTGTIRHLPLLSAFAAALLLGGCGGGVDLEGPGFEALGITSKKHADKKVPDRAPLLIPPDQTRLPEPTMSTATAAAAPQNWPTDPGDLAKAEASDAEKKKKQYEDKGDWSKKADIDEFEKAMDPLERSNTGLLDKWYQGQKKTGRGVEVDDPTHLDPGNL